MKTQNLVQKKRMNGSKLEVRFRPPYSIPPAASALRASTLMRETAS